MNFWNIVGGAVMSRPRGMASEGPKMLRDNGIELEVRPPWFDDPKEGEQWAE